MLHKRTSKSKGLMLFLDREQTTETKRKAHRTGLPFRHYFARALVRFFANESRHIEIIRPRLHQWSIQVVGRALYKTGGRAGKS